MTSILKSALTYDSSQLVQGDTADATDVLLATNDLLENDQAGRLSVTASDTHVKHLNDAIAAGSGIAKTVTNPGADEALSLSVDPAVVATLTGSQSLSNKTLVTPTIASMTNAQHNHQNAAGGGQLTLAALAQSGAASGEVPMWNGSAWTSAPPGGVPAPSPVDVTTIVAGETLAERDFVYVSATGWKKVDIDASPVAMGRTRGIVIESGGIANGVTGAVRVIGEVTGFSGLTALGWVWADSTAGGYTQTRPTPSLGGSQVAVVPIGLAVSTSRILLMGPARVEYRRRASLANNATLLLEHHSDPFGEGRTPKAFINTSDQITLQTYDLANKDADLQIKGTAQVISVDNAGASLASVGNNSGQNTRIYQSVTLPIAGYLERFRIAHGATTGSPTGQITVSLWTASGNNLGVSLSQSTTYTPAASSTNTVIFANPVWLPASTPIIILFEAVTQTSGNYWTIQYNNSGAYAGGAARQEQSAGAFTNVFSGSLGDLRMLDFTTLAITRFAQGFSNTLSAIIPTVRLYARKQGSPTGDLKVEIYSDNAGNPDTLLASSDVINASTLTGSYAWYGFTFASPYTITGGTPYHFVVSTTETAGNTNYVELGADVSSSSYANGVAKSETSATWRALGGDLIFDILTYDTAYAEPCVVGRSSGGTRDIAVRYDSGVSGVNTATNTLGKNVTGSTLDLTFVVEMD